MVDGFVATTMALLIDVPGDELQDAMLHLARTTTWRPNAADIRRTVVKLRGLFPSEAEAGEIGREYARKKAKVRTSGPQKVYPVVHPAIADAVDAAGADFEAAFVKAYREAVDRRITEIAGEPLNRPVEFRPVPVVPTHLPADLTWSGGGWRTPSGQLVHADRGDQFPGRLGPSQIALPTGAPRDRNHVGVSRDSPLGETT